MKTRPYLLLFFLIIILIFILGVRYGQRVEKNNKVVDYLLNLPSPTTPITPTPLITPSAGLEIKKDASASPTLFNLKK